MPVSDDVLERARRSDDAAVESLLAEVYPSIHRIALAVAGREPVARRVADGVLDRGLEFLPTWRRGITPENWFYHHTVMTARDAAARAGPPTPSDDPLITHAKSADAGYPAFIRGLRGLPAQQVEAFLLYHGEHLNERLLGVAMDCSAQAATNHLRAATASLAAMAGGPIDGQIAILSRAYTALTPPAADAPHAIRPHIRRMQFARFKRRIIRLITALLFLLILAAAGYAVWRWRHGLPIVPR